MKNWKQNLIVCFMLIIILTFITCDNENEKNDPVCTCDKGIVHIDNCNNICPNGKGNAPCTHKDPEPIVKEYPIELESKFGHKAIITIKYMALPNAEIPSYLEHLKVEMGYFAGDYPDIMEKISSNDYIIELEYSDYYTGFNSTVGSKIIKVHYKYLSDVEEIYLFDQNDKRGWLDEELGNAFSSLFANVMMNNIIRMV